MIEETIIKSQGLHVFSYPTQWLDNEDEALILFNEDGVEVDITHMLSDKDNNDRSWQRYPNGKDEDTRNDWTARAIIVGYYRIP